MRTTLIAALLCVATSVLPGAHAQQTEALRKRFAETKVRADQGDPWAQNDLGVCYYEGRGVKKDAAEAVKWFRLAADQKLARAQGALGDFYSLGIGVVQNQGEAVKWYRLAADQNYAEAQFRLGLHLLEGQGVAKDAPEAVQWFRKAAEQNLPDAQAGLGAAYQDGLGVGKDAVEAQAWFQLAAKSDKDAAELRDALAKKLTAAELAQARKRTQELGIQAAATEREWKEKNAKEDAYRRAFFMAKARNPALAAQAQTQVQPIEARRKELRAKADQGDARAQWELGQAYSIGAPLDMKDDPQAVQWFKKAAEQNFVPALNSLGYFYSKGYGVAMDLTEAAKWYRRAAEQNSVQAQVALGSLYRDAIGAKQNLVDAYAWYDVANKTDDAKAATTRANAARWRDEVLTRLTPEQAVAARKRAEELRAQITARLNSGGK